MSEITPNYFSQQNSAVASWFLGPRAENSHFVREIYKEITNEHIKARSQYYPKDPSFITDAMQNSPEFQSNIRRLREQISRLSNSLGTKTIPFWSPRYMGHMGMESSMPGSLGYAAALQYNQNNVAIEGSPLTTRLEVFAGKQLCEMLGFTVHWNVNENIRHLDDEIETPPEDLPKIRGWGHITCDGSVANLESIWAARNLKFYPLSLRLAVDEGLLSFIGSSFEVELANYEKKLLKECTTWELLNLKPTTVLDIPDRLYSEYGISPKYLQDALQKYSIQTVGKDYLEKRFNVTESTLYFAGTTMHYAWPKGCAIVGIGSKNLIPVPVDNAARMDIDELRDLLDGCVKKKQAVYAVVAIMGSTEHGACDPLSDIIELRKEYERTHGLSFVIHADAAWGGYFRSMLVRPPMSSERVVRRRGHEEEGDSFVPMLALKPYTEKHLYSLKYCDSVTVDPHKSGYIPYPAGGLCYRDQRMKYLNTWISPVAVRPKEESMAVYGVEGSKPGAAAVAAWLSHDTIGLHQKGYGLLLGQATFSCTKLYCHWATMSTEQDDFIVVPFNPLPAGNPEEIKRRIRTLIVEKSNVEIVNNPSAMELIRRLGSDLMINTFACNFKVDGIINEDIAEANYLNQRLYERFSLTNTKEKNADKPLILTSTRFKRENYRSCLTNFKDRLGLTGSQDLYTLINVVMSPWVTEFEFLRELTSTFKEALRDVVKISVKRNKVEPDHHIFAMQGIGDKLYFTNSPMFQMANHRQQVIITASLPENVRLQYFGAREANPSHVYFLGNQDKLTLDEIARDGSSFRGIIYRGFDPKTEKPIEWIRNFRVTHVRVIKKRHLDTKFQDAKYPEGHMPFYIYGTEQELHIDHMLLKSPSIQLSADRVKLDLTSGSLSRAQREHGVIAHITDVNEFAMQPFPEIKPFGIPQKNSFFFQKGRTFQVELYEDPKSDSDQDGPNLNNVQQPIAKGTIRLPYGYEGCLYIDSYMINKDPTADEKVKPGEGCHSRKFDHVAELHWYEETKKRESMLDYDYFDL